MSRIDCLNLAKHFLERLIMQEWSQDITPYTLHIFQLASCCDWEIDTSANYSYQ